jgi:hypothetical protein
MPSARTLCSLRTCSVAPERRDRAARAEEQLDRFVLLEQPGPQRGELALLLLDHHVERHQ